MCGFYDEIIMVEFWSIASPKEENQNALSDWIKLS